MLAIFISLRKLAVHHNIWGAIAQLVERMNGIHEATGSNPVSSTSLRLCDITKSSQRSHGWLHTIAKGSHERSA